MNWNAYPFALTVGRSDRPGEWIPFRTSHAFVRTHQSAIGCEGHYMRRDDTTYYVCSTWIPERQTFLVRSIRVTELPIRTEELVVVACQEEEVDGIRAKFRRECEGFDVLTQI